MAILLMSLASGWKTLHKDFDPDDSLEIFLPLTALVLMLEFICTALTYVDDDSHHKYHDYDGLQGWGLFTIKMIVYLFFAYQVYDVRKKVSKRQNQFINSLFSLGSAYLLAVPISILMVHAFAPSERQYMFTLISQVLMFVANMTIYYLLSSSKSTYRKTSTDHAGLDID